MGNFRSIEEVERMASIVSDMEKSKPIGKSGPYDMCVDYGELLSCALEERDSIIKYNK